MTGAGRAGARARRHAVGRAGRREERAVRRALRRVAARRSVDGWSAHPKDCEDAYTQERLKDAYLGLRGRTNTKTGMPAAGGEYPPLRVVLRRMRGRRAARRAPRRARRSGGRVLHAARARVDARGARAVRAHRARRRRAVADRGAASGRTTWPRACSRCSTSSRCSSRAAAVSSRSRSRSASARSTASPTPSARRRATDPAAALRAHLGETTFTWFEAVCPIAALLRGQLHRRASTAACSRRGSTRCSTGSPTCRAPRVTWRERVAARDRHDASRSCARRSRRCCAGAAGTALLAVGSVGRARRARACSSRRARRRAIERPRRAIESLLPDRWRTRRARRRRRGAPARPWCLTTGRARAPRAAPPRRAARRAGGGAARRARATPPGAATGTRRSPRSRDGVPPVGDAVRVGLALRRRRARGGSARRATPAKIRRLREAARARATEVVRRGPAGSRKLAGVRFARGVACVDGHLDCARADVVADFTWALLGPEPMRREARARLGLARRRRAPVTLALAILACLALAALVALWAARSAPRWRPLQTLLVALVPLAAFAALVRLAPSARGVVRAARDRSVRAARRHRRRSAVRAADVRLARLAGRVAPRRLWYDHATRVVRLARRLGRGAGDLRRTRR